MVDPCAWFTEADGLPTWAVARVAAGEVVEEEVLFR